jgi:hypothetical protein
MSILVLAPPGSATVDLRFKRRLALASSMEFWFEFDNFFNPRFGQLGDGVQEAYTVIGPIFKVRDRWHEHRRLGTYPDGFREEMEPKREAILQLAGQQLAIVDRHFAGDEAAEQTAVRSRRPRARPAATVSTTAATATPTARCT